MGGVQPDNIIENNVIELLSIMKKNLSEVNLIHLDFHQPSHGPPAATGYAGLPPGLPGAPGVVFPAP